MVSYLPGPPSSSALCHENQGAICLAVTWILLTIGIITVSLRLYVRLDIRHNVGWDDYTAVASLVRGSSSTHLMGSCSALPFAYKTDYYSCATRLWA